MDDVENILKEDMHVEKPVECDGSHEGNIVDANVSINLSQQQLQLTSPCSACGKITTKKDRVLECSKCKKLTHYLCSRLPGYAIFSLKNSKRQYVCEVCADPPEEYQNNYDNREELEDKDK